MSVNETTMQNVWQHHFLQPGALSEVGETVAYIWPQVVKKATLQEIYKNYRFITAPPVVHIWLTFLEVFIL
jgi:hypothetical protein